MTQVIAAILAVTGWTEMDLMADATITIIVWIETITINLIRGHEEMITWA